MKEDRSWGRCSALIIHRFFSAMHLMPIPAFIFHHFFSAPLRQTVVFRMLNRQHGRRPDHHKTTGERRAKHKDDA